MNHDEETVEIAASLVHETDAAWLIDDGTREVWLPKSQCEMNGDGTFSVPEWLALNKGLI